MVRKSSRPGSQFHLRSREIQFPTTVRPVHAINTTLGADRLVHWRRLLRFRCRPSIPRVRTDPRNRRLVLLKRYSIFPHN